MYEHFKKFVKTQKRNFNEIEFENNIMYRATCFRQFGRVYKWACEKDNIPNNYDELRFEVMMYQSRINGMRKEI